LIFRVAPMYLKEVFFSFITILSLTYSQRIAGIIDIADG
jgi:hypothetical protein